MIQVGRLDSKQTGYDIKLAMQIKNTFPSCVCNVLMENNDLGIGRKL